MPRLAFIPMMPSPGMIRRCHELRDLAQHPGCWQLVKLDWITTGIARLRICRQKSSVPNWTWPLK